jgi:hypothetical protein
LRNSQQVALPVPAPFPVRRRAPPPPVQSGPPEVLDGVDHSAARGQHA